MLWPKNLIFQMDMYILPKNGENARATVSGAREFSHFCGSIYMSI